MFLGNIRCYFVLMWAINPRIARSPCFSRDWIKGIKPCKSNQSRIKIRIYVRRVDLTKFWEERRRKSLPQKIKACIVSRGGYGCILDCIERFVESVSILWSLNEYGCHDFVALEVFVVGDYLKMKCVGGAYQKLSISSHLLMASWSMRLFGWDWYVSHDYTFM